MNAAELRRRLPAYCAILLSLCLGGCGGLTFTDRPDLDKVLPDNLLGTSVFTDTEILKRHLDEIPGIVVVDDGSGNVRETAFILKPGYKPSVTTLKDPGQFYHSVVDHEAGVSGGYLALLSGSLNSKQTAEVTITETAESFIGNADVPLDAIEAWVQAHPKQQPQEKRYYVQGALLSTATQTIYVEVGKSATVDGGAAFGVKGNYYQTDKSSATSSIALIGAHLLDIDAIVEGAPRQGPPAEGQFAVTKVFHNIEFQ